MGTSGGASAAASLQALATQIIPPAVTLREATQPAAAAMAAQAAQPVRIDTIPMPRAPRAAAPAYEQTLADLGDRLSWLGALVEDIQQETKGTANPRLAELTGTLAESMGEVRELQRKLGELLAAGKP
jgi:hypothetical protein